MPIGCVPVLPGDTFQHSTNVLIRVTPLNTPVMHPVTVRIHHFFVPNRVVMPEWEDFITGGNDGAGEATSIPTLTSTATASNLHTYLGVPPIAGIEYNSLPVLGANLIHEEYYRDQDLTPSRATGEQTLGFIAWEKDYFTTARPWTQRGPEVVLPLGDSAPIHTPAQENNNVSVFADQEAELRLLNAPGLVTIGSVVGAEANALYADLSQAAGTNVNDVRTAFSLQRYQEARARYGARFTEYLRYLGITPSDARLQRPEYLGGGSARLNFSEVLQTSAKETPVADEASVGDLYGHGIAGVRTNRYRKFFEEHGYVHTMLSVRPKSIYMNGIPREFVKTTKEDFYQKELANLGQQEVFNKEVAMAHAEPDDVFGYQDRYSEYRSHPSNVGQDFRTTLNSWHLGRDLDGSTALNDAFVRCHPSDRIYQVSRSVADPLWIMANHHIVARRMVPKRANPRIL